MLGSCCSTKKWKSFQLQPQTMYVSIRLTINKGRNFIFQCKPALTSGPKHSCATIYNRRCLILCATKRTGWLMSCVQQTGTQSQSVFIMCCHLPGNCSTTHHIVATDEYLKERKQFVLRMPISIYVDEYKIYVLSRTNEHFCRNLFKYINKTAITTWLNVFKNTILWRYYCLRKEVTGVFSKLH